MEPFCPSSSADCPVAPLLERLERREERLAELVRKAELTVAAMQATIATFDDKYDHLRRKIELETTVRVKSLDDLKHERTSALETRSKVWVAMIGAAAVVVAAAVSTITSKQTTAMAREQAEGIANQRVGASDRRFEAALTEAAKEGARQALEDRQPSMEVISAR
jgi:hypothetical protein